MHDDSSMFLGAKKMEAHNYLTLDSREFFLLNANYIHGIWPSSYCSRRYILKVIKSPFESSSKYIERNLDLCWRRSSRRSSGWHSVLLHRCSSRWWQRHAPPDHLLLTEQRLALLPTLHCHQIALASSYLWAVTWRGTDIKPQLGGEAPATCKNIVTSVYA
jgi:hypothetical protein